MPNKFCCPLCGGVHFTKIFEYDAPPPGEIRFDFRKSAPYHREYWQCHLCGHFVSSHSLDLSALYSGEYVNTNYQDMAGIRKTFERIISLDPSKSDNTGRVKRILEFAAAFWGKREQPPTLLDVGSGIGVFPYAMKKAGWQCTALDPDDRSVRHAREAIQVASVKGDFLEIKNLGTFDAITFNKVLEHVVDPVKMLAKARENLKPGGFVYAELPDGELAAREGKGREEFFVEHLHVFSFSSTALLAKRAGFGPVSIERLKEPSTKYTLRAFLVPVEQKT